MIFRTYVRIMLSRPCSYAVIVVSYVRVSHSLGRSQSVNHRGTLKTWDWKTWDQTAGVEFTGLENAGPNFQS